MRKIFITAFLLVLSTAGSFAQRRDTTVNYMSNSGLLADSKTTADFIRILTPPDTTNKDLTIINDFYLSGKRKLTARTHNVISYGLTWLEGACIEYFENGHRKSITSFNNGKAVGDVIRYFPNGQIYTVVNNGFLILCQDSTGRVLAEEGSGEWVKFDKDFNYIAQGPVVKGLEDGVWNGVANNQARVSVYKNGELVSGIAFGAPVGNPLYEPFVNYEKHPDVPPVFKNDPHDFTKFMANNIRYPKSARQYNIQGRVIAAFVVEKDGSVSEVKVLRHLSEDTDAEAVRVIKLSPAWKPGYKDGKPVRTVCSVPINFSLSPESTFIPGKSSTDF